MGNRIAGVDLATVETVKVAGKESEGQDGRGRSIKTSLNNSDSFDSIPSNLNPESSASKWGNATEMSIQDGRRRILIVDDELAIADTLALIFRTQHYDARVAYSAESAIELIAAWRPDLAILDVILPGMTGIDLAIVTKANHPRCQVLLFSGHANTTMLLEEAGKKGHQFEVLPKPVHPTVMLERASALLADHDEPMYD